MPKHDPVEIPTIPLFEIERVYDLSGAENGRYKPQGISAWCPGCKKEDPGAHPRAVGILTQGGHYVYRVHTRINQDDQRHDCPCSGIRLCDAPPIVRTHGLERVEVCLCGRSNI